MPVDKKTNGNSHNSLAGTPKLQEENSGLSSSSKYSSRGMSIVLVSDAPVEIEKHDKFLISVLII